MTAAISGPVEPLPRTSGRNSFDKNFLFDKSIINADTYFFLIRNQKAVRFQGASHSGAVAVKGNQIDGVSMHGNQI